jgi:ketose-bisphosphate aldolase
MPLESVGNLMAGARRGGYALGYFESWNVGSLQGVLDAAEAVRAPVIIGFNGDFLSRRTRRVPERLALYAELGKAAARAARVPCALTFNECPDDAWVLAAIDLGFNLVMPTGEQTPYDEYVRRIRSITERAHQRQVAVEAELGVLPCGASGQVEGDNELTDPALAERFVRNTGIDLLAVSVGNIHISIAGEQALNLEHLAAIHERVPIPLVLHGGTGVTADSLREAIRLGVAKVNYGTYLKQAYLAALRAALSTNQGNPHELLGVGDREDVMVAGRIAVRDAVLERITTLGCCGMAEG